MFIHIFNKNEFIKTVKYNKETEQLILGRDESCDIPLAFDDIVSSNHAKVTFEGNNAYLTDLKSKNGIFIDGKRIKEVKIPFEKKIFMGNCAIVFSKVPFKEIKKTVVLDDKILKKMKKDISGYEADDALAFLYNISTKIGKYQNEDSMLEDLFEELLSAFKLDRVILFDVVKKRKDVVVRKLKDARFVDERKSFASSVIQDILNNREAVFLRNVMQEVPDSGKSIRTLGVNSLIAVPLIVGDSITGILQVEYFQFQKQFQDKDLYIMCILCQIISGFLKGVRTLSEVKRENKVYREQIDNKIEMIGDDKKTLSLKETIKKVAKTNTTVFVTGESGCGKELVAKSIHFNSRRKNKPYLVINCSAIAQNLIESELFGHVKGAFTGATKTRIGKLEAADGGTVFLDEIGDMGYDLQTRLLRFLESGELQPLGSNETKYTDVRVISATNRDLKSAIKSKTFRNDLYYRLSVFQIECPPLRARGNDILKIAQYYLQKFSTSMGKNMFKISGDAEKILKNYPWYGNIRELKNIIERACVIGDGLELTPDLLPKDVKEGRSDFILEEISNEDSITLDEVERRYILNILKKCENNKAKTSNILGITRKTLYSKLKEYKIID
ncbi:MAG: sigma 54-interacting transcriptional regulator [Candidatus Aureabacteria bacterium]|nr:sigma 54-interacting transcriptional regulator [Candidatus Auribacterota bacterium]